MLVQVLGPIRQAVRHLVPMRMQRRQMSRFYPGRIKMLEHIKLRNGHNRAEGGVAEEMRGDEARYLDDVLECGVDSLEGYVSDRYRGACAWREIRGFVRSPGEAYVPTQ